MSTIRSVMIGVIHRDPDGENRLFAALHNYNPSLITIEVSHYAIDFRKKHSGRLLVRLNQLVPSEKQDHVEIQTIREMLKIPFEISAAEKYAIRSNAHVELIDDCEVSREYLRSVESELITKENLSHLIARKDQPLSNVIAAKYRRYRALLTDEPLTPAWLNLNEKQVIRIQERDEKMESFIRSLLYEVQPNCWVHIGGVEHLLRVKGFRLLWDRFADINAERLFLDEL